MKACLFALGVSLCVLLAGCGDDDDKASNAAAGGDTSSASGGGTSNGAGGSGAGAPDEAASQEAARSELCTRVCTTEAELPCGGDVSACAEAWCGAATVLPECADEADVMLRCFSKEPVESYYCDGTDPYPKEEICAGEVAAFDSCLGG